MTKALEILHNLPLIFLIILSADCIPYHLGDGAGLQPETGRTGRRQARFFDTYVTHVPSPVMEGGLPTPLDYYYYPTAGGFQTAGGIPPGYSMFHPFDLGLSPNYLTNGGTIYCPADYVYDGYVDPFEYGICFMQYSNYYY